MLSGVQAMDIIAMRLQQIIIIMRLTSLQTRSLLQSTILAPPGRQHHIMDIFITRPMLRIILMTAIMNITLTSLRHGRHRRHHHGGVTMNTQNNNERQITTLLILIMTHTLAEAITVVVDWARIHINHTCIHIMQTTAASYAICRRSAITFYKSSYLASFLCPVQFANTISQNSLLNYYPNTEYGQDGEPVALRSSAGEVSKRLLLHKAERLYEKSWVIVSYAMRQVFVRMEITEVAIENRASVDQSLLMHGQCERLRKRFSSCLAS